jgi:hypothetical protein
VKQVIKLTGFILIGTGTAGLLITELAFHGGNTGSPNFTLIFAVVNVVGFAALAFARWGVKRKA